jgi:hypothetical protein
MLLKSTQPESMKEALEHISASVEIESSEDEADMKELNSAMNNLEAALLRMEKLGKREARDGRPSDSGPHGLQSVPPTHEAIFNHSRRGPRAKFMWISKTSMVDHEGNLGYPATVEIRRYGDTGKVFISKPPLELQKSFAEVMMNWEENRPAKRPWARCGDEERGGVKDSGMED